MHHRTGRLISSSRWLAVAFALAIVAAACGGGDDSSGGDGFGGGADSTAQDGSDATGGTETESEPVPGGTIVMGLEAETDGLAPWTSAFADAGHQMAYAVFDTISKYDEDDEPQPYLAESWESNEDCSQWTVTLRDGITFHDGTPLNADAVRINVEAQLNDPLVGLAVRPYWNNEEPITVVDDLTYTVNLNGPDCRAPATWTTQLGYVASPQWMAAAMDDPDLLQEPVGTGPFVFDDRVQDSRTRFVRNEDYWAGPVYPDAVEFVIQPDGARRADSLMAGDTNLLHTTSITNIDRMSASDPSIVHHEKNLGSETIVMMNAQAPPFDDPEVRRILTLATPRQQYADTFVPGREMADSMFHPSSKFKDPTVVQEGDEFEDAATAAAAWCADHADMCDGDKINMSFKRTAPSVENDQVEAVLRSGWEKAFNVASDQVLQDDYIQQVALGQYQVVTWRQFGATEPGRDRVWFDCDTIDAISLNFARNCNETTQAALELQAETRDEDERVEAWKTIQQQMNADYIYVFLNHTIWDIAHADDVHGYGESPLPDGGFAREANGGTVWLHNLWIEE